MKRVYAPKDIVRSELPKILLEGSFNGTNYLMIFESEIKKLPQLSRKLKEFFYKVGFLNLGNSCIFFLYVCELKLTNHGADIIILILQMRKNGSQRC